MSMHIKWLDDDHLFAHMAAYDDDDAPDGAWWAKLEDGVVQYNQQHHTNHDPFESVHKYIQHLEAKDG